MKIIKQSIFLANCLMLASCARTFQVVPLAAQDPARASILVYRKNLSDVNSGVSIYCNDSFVGKVGLYRYIKWSVVPGHYTVKAKSIKAASYSLDVAASGEYQLTVEKTVGVPTGVRLKPAQKQIDIQSVRPPKIKRGS